MPVTRVVARAVREEAVEAAAAIAGTSAHHHEAWLLVRQHEPSLGMLAGHQEAVGWVQVEVDKEVVAQATGEWEMASAGGVEEVVAETVASLAPGMPSGRASTCRGHSKPRD